MKEFEIKKLSSSSGDDLLHFFDHDAFIDNPHWAGCFCQFYLTDHRTVDWESRTAEQNRVSAEKKIETGEMKGYLAYMDGKVVGWCHAAPRSGIVAVAGDPELACEDEDEVGAIVCFIVAPGERGKGIASKLLEAACEGFQDLGLKWAEVYPRIGAVSQAANYHGPQQMYEQAGFHIYQSFPKYLVMRKRLQ